MKNTNERIFFVVLGILIASAFYANLLLFTDVGSVLSDNKNQDTKTVSSETKTAESRVTRSIPLVALNHQTQKGVIGEVSVRLIPGNANVLVQTNPFVGTDLQYSTNNAVTIAKLMTNQSVSNYDYILDYKTPQSQVLGGGSAGAGTTIAIIAALTQQQIDKSAVVTGTIEQDGSIGNVGGIFEKAQAVAKAGFETFYIPEGQDTLYYYQRGPQPFQIQRKTLELTTYAKQQWNLTVEEVATIDKLKKKMIY
jgi:uncharacterized protein